MHQCMTGKAVYQNIVLVYIEADVDTYVSHVEKVIANMLKVEWSSLFPVLNCSSHQKWVLKTKKKTWEYWEMLVTNVHT